MLVTDGALYRIIQDTWTSTLGFQVERHAPTEFSALEAFTVCVRISGAWDGEVRLHCSPPLARRIAAAIFQVEENKVGSSEILDALSELIHIIGGNLKSFLPQPVTLSLPSLLGSTTWGQTTPPWQMVCRLTLQSEGHPFVVSLFGRLSHCRKRETPSD